MTVLPFTSSPRRTAKAGGLLLPELGCAGGFCGVDLLVFEQPSSEYADSRHLRYDAG